jgi:hypothetical protein
LGPSSWLYVESRGVEAVVGRHPWGWGGFARSVVLLSEGGWLAPTLMYATSVWVIWRRSGCRGGEGPGAKLDTA